MKRFSSRSGHTSMAELNVTPLLDLAFVLLIIFIITTPLMEQSIDVSTPSTSARPSAIDPADVRMLTLDQNGNIYIDKKPVQIAELEEVLYQMKKADPQLAVGIRADKRLAYEKVVAVLDALQRAGISQFGLITQVE